MRSICLNFEINKPSLNFSIEDINNDELLKLNNKLAKELFDNYYFKLNSIISDIISEFGSLVKFNFNISASTIEYYKKFAPSFVEQISNFDNRSVSFNKYISNIDSYQNSNLLLKEILNHEQLVSDVFKSNTNDVIYIGNYLSEELLVNIPILDGIIIKKLISENTVNNIIKTKNGVKLLQTDINFSNLFVDGDMSMSKIINYLNNKSESVQFVNLNLNYSDFIDNDILFDNLRSLPEKVMSQSNFTFNSIEEIIRYAKVSNDNFSQELLKSITEILNHNDVFKVNGKHFTKISNLYKSQSNLIIPIIWEEINSTDLYINYENGFYSNTVIKKYIKQYKNTKISTLVNRKYILIEEFIEEQIEHEFLQNTQYRFTDLETMPKVKLKKLLTLLDASTIFYSIQNQSNTLKDKVLSNIPLRVLSSIEKLMEIPSSEISLIEVKNARRRILNKLKKI